MPLDPRSVVPGAAQYEGSYAQEYIGEPLARASEKVAGYLSTIGQDIVQPFTGGSKTFSAKLTPEERMRMYQDPSAPDRARAFAGMQTRIAALEQENQAQQAQFKKRMVDMNARNTKLQENKTMNTDGTINRSVKGKSPDGSSFEIKQSNVVEQTHMPMGIGPEEQAYRARLQAMKSQQPGVNLQPVAQLVDTMTGSRMAQGIAQQDRDLYMREQRGLTPYEKLYGLERQTKMDQAQKLRHAQELALKREGLDLRKATTGRAKEAKQIDFATKLKGLRKDETVPLTNIKNTIIENKESILANPRIPNALKKKLARIAKTGGQDIGRVVDSFAMDKVRFLQRTQTDPDILKNIDRIYFETIDELEQMVGG